MIRHARPQEMAEILELLAQVFEGEQGIPRELNAIDEASQPVWWCDIEDGVLAGTVASWTENGQRHMGRFAIRRQWRGKHLGTALITHALAEEFARGADAITGEARDATVHILSRLGGEASGRPFVFHEGLCTPVTVTRERFLAATQSGEAPCRSSP